MTDAPSTPPRFTHRLMIAGALGFLLLALAPTVAADDPPPTPGEILTEPDDLFDWLCRQIPCPNEICEIHWHAGSWTPDAETNGGYFVWVTFVGNNPNSLMLGFPYGPGTISVGYATT